MVLMMNKKWEIEWCIEDDWEDRLINAYTFDGTLLEINEWHETSEDHYDFPNHYYCYQTIYLDKESAAKLIPILQEFIDGK